MTNYPTSGIPADLEAAGWNHGQAWSELAAVAAAPPASVPYLSGRWYNLPYASTQSLTPTEAQIMLTWHPVPYGKIIAGIAENIVTVGTTGAVRRLGLYAHNISTGLPDALIQDLGTYDAVTSTGIKSLSTTGSPTVPNYGGIWVAGVTQGAAGTRPVITGQSIASPAVSFAAAGNIGTSLGGWQTTATTHTGALPANIGALSVAGAAPRTQIGIG